MCLSALSNSFLDFKVDLGYIRNQNKTFIKIKNKDFPNLLYLEFLKSFPCKFMILSKETVRSVIEMLLTRLAIKGKKDG